MEGFMAKMDTINGGKARRLGMCWGVIDKEDTIGEIE
jgi:hypothetical protein